VRDITHHPKPDSTPQPFWLIKIGFSDPRAVDAFAGERVRSGPVPDHDWPKAPRPLCPEFIREQAQIPPLTLR